MCVSMRMIRIEKGEQKRIIETKKVSQNINKIILNNIQAFTNTNTNQKPSFRTEMLQDDISPCHVADVGKGTAVTNKGTAGIPLPIEDNTPVDCVPEMESAPSTTPQPTAKLVEHKEYDEQEQAYKKALRTDGTLSLSEGRMVCKQAAVLLKKPKVPVPSVVPSRLPGQFPKGTNLNKVPTTSPKRSRETGSPKKPKKKQRRNPPSEKQINFLKRLCAEKSKAFPPVETMETLTKKTIGALIDVLLHEPNKWEYGEDGNPPFVAPTEKQMKWLHGLCDQLGLGYPENADLPTSYSIQQWRKDIDLLRALKSKPTKLTPTVWPYGAGGSIQLLQQFQKGKRPKITLEHIMEFMKHYGSKPVQLMPEIYNACREAYSMSGRAWDEMNNYANGYYGDATPIAEHVLRTYNKALVSNKRVTKVPYAIRSIRNEKDKQIALYAFWSRERRDDMLPFDNDTVQQLKLKSKFQWKSSHFFQAHCSSNNRYITYTDKYIQDQLRTKFPELTTDDIRLGLAKCRRCLIVFNGIPTGETRL